MEDSTEGPHGDFLGQCSNSSCPETENLLENPSKIPTILPSTTATETLSQSPSSVTPIPVVITTSNDFDQPNFSAVASNSAPCSSNLDRVVERRTTIRRVSGSFTSAGDQGNSAANGHGTECYDQSVLYNLHPGYLEPLKVEHPLEENVLLAFGRGCCFYLMGFFVGIPMITISVILVLVILPVKIVAHLLTKLTCRGLYRGLLSKRHCDPWWPLEHQSLVGKKKGNQGCGSPRSLVQQLPLQCVVTLQGSVSVDDLKALLSKKLIGVEDSSGRRKYPKFTQIVSGDCCCGLSRSWDEQRDFKVEEHVIGLYENLTSVVDLETNSLNASGDSENNASGPSGHKPSGAGGVWTLKDLEIELNQLAVTRLDSKRPLWSVDVVPNFGESRCTLLVFRFHSVLTDALCIPKLFSLLNDGQLSFDSEPKLRSSVLPPYNLFVSISYTLWTWCQMVTAGPLSLVVSGFRSPNKVWENSAAWMKRKSNSLQPSMSSARRIRDESIASLESGASQRLAPLSMSSSMIGTSQRNLALKRVTWARVPNVEQMMRAERILRSSTIELLLSFIAGALRRHFRSQGIRYPPDIQISVPVSCREFLPIAKHQPCRFLTVPIILPVSVEGSIPRVWEVQRLMADALDGPFPQAMKAATSLGDLILPSAWCKKLLQKTHRGSSCVISYLRLNGESNINQKRIHSMLMYPPTPAGVRSAFTFIQAGHEIVVSLSVDQRTFPDPDIVLASFQAELQSLLRQLALRMLTLSQATFLPAPLLARLSGRKSPTARSPYLSSMTEFDDSDKDEAARKLLDIQTQIERNNNRRIKTEEENSEESSQLLDNGNSPATDSSFLRAMEMSPDQASTSSAAFAEEEESLEELESLMITVQAELDAMRANPRGNRAEYIAKLAELESKMEKFHRAITERLRRSGNLHKRSPSESDVVDIGLPTEALLQPYREEAECFSLIVGPPGAGGTHCPRKDSGGGFKLRRKKSKRLDSPTRISPNRKSSSAKKWEADHP